MSHGLVPAYLTDVETRMRIVGAHEYERLNKETFWRKLAKELPSAGKRERMIWLLDTAKIEYVNRFGSEVTFEDILSNTIEYEAKAATGGFKIGRNELEDHDAGGVQLAAHWARQMGDYAAYWPQKQILKAINAGTLASSLAYDGLPFFSASHVLNPFDTSLGTYVNLFTGGASAGVTPGACPINGVTTDVALDNLARAVTFVEGQYLMPNGEDPRRLKVGSILAPTALKTQLTKALDSKFIAAGGTGGAGSADNAGLISMLGMGEPLIAPELGARFTNGSDTAYYLIAESVSNDDVGAFTYVNREAFSIVFNGEMTDAELSRANEIQWITRGRNVVGYGHPYLIFKVLAT